MLILAHNFKFNIQHHLVVVDGIVGGGTILCDGSLYQVTYESVKLKLYNRSSIDHSTTQRKLRPFWGVWQATRTDDAAECKSTLDLLPEDLSLSENSHKGQNGKATGCCCFCFLFFCFCFFVRCRFPGFFSAMSNTAT